MSVTCGRSVVSSIQHYVIKFVSDLRQVGGFLYTTLCDSLSVTCGRSVVPPGTLVSSTNKTWFNWNIIESGVKYHNHNPPVVNLKLLGIISNPVFREKLEDTKGKIRGFTALVVIDTDYTGGCISNYHRIKTTSNGP